MTIRESNIILEGKNSEPATFSEEGIIQQTYIDKTQDDDMYKKFGIIQNQIYHFELKDCTSINGIIMNFDYNTFCVMGVKGMYIIKRSDIDSMCPSKISKDKWEESRVKYLESFIETK